MTLAFPHSDACPICSSSCDEVEALRRENRVLRALVLGAVWVAATSSRPTTTDLAALDQVHQLAVEALGVAGVLGLDTDVLSALFPEEETTP